MGLWQAAAFIGNRIASLCQTRYRVSVQALAGFILPLNNKTSLSRGANLIRGNKTSLVLE